MSQPPEGFQSSYEEEGFGSAIVRNFREKPVVMTGIIAMVASCGYGYWRFKTKGYTVSPSLFLLQLRVGAQSAVVGIITLGMVYNMITTLNAKKNKVDN